MVLTQFLPIFYYHDKLATFLYVTNHTNKLINVPSMPRQIFQKSIPTSSKHIESKISSDFRFTFFLKMFAMTKYLSYWKGNIPKLTPNNFHEDWTLGFGDKPASHF